MLWSTFYLSQHSVGFAVYIIMNALIQSFTDVHSNFKQASCSLWFQRIGTFRVYYSPNTLTALSTSRKLRGLRNLDNRSPSRPLPLQTDEYDYPDCSFFTAMTSLGFAHWLRNLQFDWELPFWVGAYTILDRISHSPSVCSPVLRVAQPGGPTRSSYTVQKYWLTCTAATLLLPAITISKRSLIAINKCHGRCCSNFSLYLQQE